MKTFAPHIQLLAAIILFLAATATPALSQPLNNPPLPFCNSSSVSKTLDQPDPLGDWSIPLFTLDEQARDAELYQGFIDSASRLEGAGDYPGAVREYVSALGLTDSAKARSRLFMKLARASAKTGDTGSMRNYLSEALKLDREAALPENSPPAAADELARLKEECFREGVLVCDSEPLGVEVYLDGKLLGETPERNDRVVEGEHLLTFKKAGYEDLTDRVTIKKGVTTTLNYMLHEASGQCGIVTDPPGARVTFDGRDAGASPATLKRISAGVHTVSFEREYYEKKEVRLTFAKGEDKAISENLLHRLLVVPVCASGRKCPMDVVGAALGRLSGRFMIDTVDYNELFARLSERNLDQAALGFFEEPRKLITLEETAVLSGVMEREDCELALVIAVDEDGSGGQILRTGLYSLANPFGDFREIRAADDAALSARFSEFLGMFGPPDWMNARCIGLRLAQKRPGFLDVEYAAPGLPAAGAGVVVGDVIVSVNGRHVKDISGYADAVSSAGRVTLDVMRGDRRLSLDIAPVACTSELPLDMPGILYNLALVDSPVRQDAGLAFLNTGNAYMSLGDYEKAAEAYVQAEIGGSSGVCNGTALYRLGRALEAQEFWIEAADAYRRAIDGYPDATLTDADGPSVKSLAEDRLLELDRKGVTGDDDTVPPI